MPCVLTHVFFFKKPNFYGISIGLMSKNRAPKWFITGPGEIACVAGSRGIPEMDPNGSATGKPMGLEWWEWLDELGKRILKKHPGPKNEYILLIIYMYIYSYNIYIDII